MMILEVSLTWSSWGLGFEINFPSTSKKFVAGCKLKCYFGFTLYFGPITVELDKEPSIVAFHCVGCHFEHTGAPAFIGPAEGLFICSDCQKKAEDFPLEISYRMPTDD